MEYKVNSRDAGVNRHSQMLGIGKAINKVFDEKVVYRPSHTRKHTKTDHSKDVLKMVTTLAPLRLCTYIKGRSFKGFEDFKIIYGVRFPKRLKERIFRHKENMVKLTKLREMAN
ncbi:hypothetical protein KUTeg_012087 [Tegillarca granosa]|uniref:Uncharacterized protein n=1 Tax=Tegillarca granosa TaxID=220873 RepID=A0ABQ9EYI6_TEGGR|nr:hypothetical protein KUTeg_012087 [Tegillarca granosa]